MLRYCFCFDALTIRNRVVRPPSENAAHTDNEAYPDLDGGIVLWTSNLVAGCRHTLNLNAVGRTVNDNSLLNTTLSYCSAVRFVYYRLRFLLTNVLKKGLVWRQLPSYLLHTCEDTDV